MHVLTPMGFASRRAAGQLLARRLGEAELSSRMAGPLVVVGLARGGVEVAAEVSRALSAPLDALAVRKVGHPWQPEYGIGAVAPGGIEFVRSHDGLSEAEVADAVLAARRKAERLDATLHAGRPRLSLEGRACILVDDGLATGVTMVAAVRWARARGAAHVVVAVPVGAATTVHGLELDEDVDAVICLVTPLDLGAVGMWYEDFRQVSDDDVVALLASSAAPAASRTAEIPAGDARLAADLRVPPHAVGWVLFAHGSGSSRSSPRNVEVAEALHDAGIATLLFDLLTVEEERDRENVFDVDLLARRLVAATRWLVAQPSAQGLPIGYFGASTGAAAALRAAAELGEGIAAVVSRGGRPDLAWAHLGEVTAPTLLVVGGADQVVLDLNESAAARLRCPHEISVVPLATHLFEEPGALEQVAERAKAWFTAQFDAVRSHMPETSPEALAR